MGFPQYLINGYLLLQNSELVKQKNVSPESLSEFERILNNIQPKDEDMAKYDMIKTLYNSNKMKFIRFIRESYSSCAVLWTESKAIVTWFDLSNLIYITWDNRRFRVELKALNTKIE
jgi:hypothetical protein